MVSPEMEVGWERSSHPDALIKTSELTHGTCECYDQVKTRAFLEEVFGLNCVQIAPEGFIFSLGVRFHVVVLEMTDSLRPLGLANHWGLKVATKEEVDDGYAKCVKCKDKYGILQVLAPIEQAWGAYSFFIEDMNHNWWEIEYYPGNLTDDFFTFGDQA